MNGGAEKRADGQGGPAGRGVRFSASCPAASGWSCQTGRVMRPA